MVDIYLSFREEIPSARLLIPQTNRVLCDGCACKGKCHGVVSDACVSFQNNHIRLKTCFHSSNLSAYLCEIFNLNLSLKKHGLVCLKSRIECEPEDELMYADIHVSDKLLEILSKWGVREFVLEAMCNSAEPSVSLRQTSFTVDPEILCDRSRRTDTSCLGNIADDRTKSTTWHLKRFCAVLRKQVNYRRGEISHWIYMESRGEKHQVLRISREDIKTLLMLNPEIEVVCIR